MTDEKKDLKPEMENSTDDGLSEESQSEIIKKELEEERKAKLELEERLKKVEEERENYKRGMLSAKAKTFSLNDDEPERPEVKPDIPEDDGWKEVDRRAETKVKDLLTDYSKKQSKENEFVAIKKFMQSHPELLSNDALLSAVKDEYNPKHGKSIEGIVIDLERAYKLYKLDNNIPLEIKREEKPENSMASIPSGNGGVSSLTSFSEDEQDVMRQFDVSPEKYKAFKEAVKKGDIEVDDATYNFLFRR